jgi:hypothetical protein
VLDCVNVVVHVFDGDSRDFYDLELLWGDSPRVDWRKELGLPAEVVMPPERTEEVAFDAEDANEVDSGDADMDEDGEADLPVVTEVPDESTGSNSVEFVETDPPATRGQKGRDTFPSTVEEEEDTTEEERGMGPMSQAEETAESLEEDEQAVEAISEKVRGRKEKGAVKKAPKKKKVVKKAAKKVAKKAKPPVKKVVKKPVKKVVKKAAKKAAGKKKK